MYVCTDVYMKLYAYWPVIYTCTYTCTCTHAYTRVHTFTYMFLCAYICRGLSTPLRLSTRPSTCTSECDVCPNTRNITHANERDMRIANAVSTQHRWLLHVICVDENIPGKMQLNFPRKQGKALRERAGEGLETEKIRNRLYIFHWIYSLAYCFFLNKY